MWATAWMWATVTAPRSRPPSGPCDGCTTSSFRWTDASGSGVTTPLERLGASSATLGPVNRATVLSDDGRFAAGFAENLAVDRSPAFWRADGSGFLLDPDQVDAPGEILTLSPDVLAEAGVSIPDGVLLTNVISASQDGTVVLGSAYDALGNPKSFVLQLLVSAYGIR